MNPQNPLSIRHVFVRFDSGRVRGGRSSKFEILMLFCSFIASGRGDLHRDIEMGESLSRWVSGFKSPYVWGQFCDSDISQVKGLPFENFRSAKKVKIL